MEPPHPYVFKMVFGILGNLIGVGVNLSPMPTFLRIYKDKNTHGFSGLPYVFSLVAALLWVLFGLPIVTPNELLLITINCASGSIQFFYISVFLTYAARKPRWHVLRVMAACFTALGVATVVTLTAVPQKQRSIFVGSLCVVIGIMTYASPLSVARMVINTKSVEFLPILLCVFFLINSSVWTCYGMITKDIFVLIPNILGVVFGVAQVALYARYHNNAQPYDDPPRKGKIGDSASISALPPYGFVKTPRASPVNGFVKTSMASPANGYFKPSMPSPFTGFVETPMASPLNGFVKTPLASPANGLINGFVKTPLGSPANGLINGFVKTPLASPANGYVKSPLYAPDGKPVKSEENLKGPSLKHSKENLQQQSFPSEGSDEPSHVARMV